MRNASVTYYSIPDEYYYRIHFVRPRFKGNIENVLLYMADACCRIPKCSCEEYNARYLQAIRMFPGNIDMANKTLHNWRTEIPALFGFYKEKKDLGYTETTRMAFFLHENQDLTQFFRLFLTSFQFPGGHIKPKDLKDVIYNNIKFKPTRTILQVLLEGNKILSAMESSKEMSISAEEATYCIFNDIRVTSGIISPQKIAKQILENRKNKIHYYNPNDMRNHSLKGKARTKGDVTRYAGDILDYMELANLVENHYGYFSLKGNELEAIKLISEDTTWFRGYEHFYNQKEIDTSALSKVEPDWFDYVNQSMREDILKTNIRTLFEDTQEVDIIFDQRIQEVADSKNRTKKDIGNLGEALVCSHEKMRLKVNGYYDFIRLVQIVDSPAYHPGYDIDSYEADGTENHRYIEVKTTISKQQINLYSFHMSPNEWRVAETIKEHYCVYRLMLSKERKTLFVLRNPVQLYKNDLIEAQPRDGMEISFTEQHFQKTELLQWKQ